MDQWRLLDTGIKTASEQMALDAALLTAKNKKSIPNTIRFLLFSPPAVLLGYHQSMDQEVRIDFCKKTGIDVNRRITGGGTIFFDTSQLGWEIICEKDFFDASIADPYFFETLSQPLIASLKALGLPACFRPRNDIEIKGKKISGTGGTEEGSVFLFQGTLLTDFDIVSMIKALRIPIEKLKDKEIKQAKERVTCLKWELAEMPTTSSLKSLIRDHVEKEWNITLTPASLTDEETRIFRSYLPRYQSAQWINKITYATNEQHVIRSIYKAEGGLIRPSLVINQRFNRIQSIVITGDFFAYPKRSIIDLEAELKDVAVDIDIIEHKIIDFFKEKNPRIPGITAIDVVESIKKALEKCEMIHYGLPFSVVNRIYTVNASFGEIIQRSPQHLLLPYCAKSVSCGYRYKRDCLICGRCSMSDAIDRGKEKNMWMRTILSFEDLMETLDEFKKHNVSSYIGCCCEAFFTKHIDDFERSMVPGILIDINDTTCYELGKENDAYEGKFESQTGVDIGLLKMVLDAIQG